MVQHDQTPEQLLRTAQIRYRQGDVYTAVKICKKLVRTQPDWSKPYVQLGAIYKDRADWKTCLHYTLKALQFDPENSQALLNLGLAYTAQKKWKAARQIWNRLGYDFKETDRAPDFDLGLVAIYYPFDKQTEVLWARRIDPARAVILSIPQPGAGRRYGDTVLFDPGAEAAQAAGTKKHRAYRELQILKSSAFKTFTVELPETTLGHLDTLAKLCAEEGIGFDNWSAAAQLYLPPSKRENPEFHLHPFPREAAPHTAIVALASKNQRTLLRVLRNWEIITLCHYQNLTLIY